MFSTYNFAAHVASTHACMHDALTTQTEKHGFVDISVDSSASSNWDQFHFIFNLFLEPAPAERKRLALAERLQDKNEG